jgi:hypothetical protein
MKPAKYEHCESMEAFDMVRRWKAKPPFYTSIVSIMRLKGPIVKAESETPSVIG